MGYTDDAFLVEVTEQTARVSTHVQSIMSNLNHMTSLQCMLDAETKLVKELLPKMLNSMEQAGELSDGMEGFLQTLADAHESQIYHIQRRLKTKKDIGELEPVNPNISPFPGTDDELDDEFDDMEEEAEEESKEEEGL